MKATMSAPSPAAASAAVPQRNAPATPVQRLPLRVLQTTRSPAQLSLFLRPKSTPR